MTRTAAALAALALLAALPSVAAPAAADASTPPAVLAMQSALRDGNPTRLLSVWPEKGTVVLFGKKEARDRAAATARFDDGVWELLHWPRDGEKGAKPVVTEATEGKGKLRLWRFQPEGKAGPVCTLRSKKGGPIALAECAEKAK